MDCLDIRAGPEALRMVRERGLSPDDADLLVAASGGPKWLALLGIDDWLMRDFLPRRTRPLPLPVLGASIGSWRAACLACREPLAARDRLLEAYLVQRYPRHPTPEEVSRESVRMLATLLEGEDRAAMVAHPRAQLHVLVSGVRGLAADRRRAHAMAGLAAAALRNLVSPRLLGSRFERLVFHGAGPEPWTRQWRDLPTRHLPLTAANLADVLLASGSIPLVLAAVHLAEWPHGALYDGGILDYHPLPRGGGPGLVLYPHFFPRVVPGWFDKALRWRHSPRSALARTLLIAPSAGWVASLPGGRIPDRRDFGRSDDARREQAWRHAAAASRRLGDELAELVATGRLASRLRAL